MLTSQIMLKCNCCNFIFEKHRWAEGEEPMAWTEALNLLLEAADEDGWSVRNCPDFQLCPDCNLDGVCPG